MPRKWALQHNIKKSDELDVKEQGRHVIISTEKLGARRKTEVNITDFDRDSLMFFIRALYKNGYDEIRINFKDPFIGHIRLNKKLKTIDVISSEITRLPGMDIFASKEDYCIIRNISEDSPKALDNMLRRVFLLTLEALQDIYEGFKESDNTILESIQIKHDNVTKFITYSQRILNKVGYEDNERNHDLYHILEIIDELMDLVKFESRMIINANIKASKESIKIYKKIHESFEICYRLFYKFNQEDVVNINKQRYEILDLLTKSIKKLSKQELSILAYMEQVSEKILNIVTSIMSFKN